MTLVMMCFIVLGLAGCQPSSSPDTNRDPSAAASPAKETLDKGAIEAELLRIERDFPRALKDKDFQATDRLEADDIVVVYPDGKPGTKAQDVEDIKNGNMTADSWEVVEAKANVLSKDTAIVSGRSIVKGGKVKGADGKPIDISGEYRWIDTFVRRDGAWKLVGSITTPLREPEGAPTASPVKTEPPPPTTKASPAPTK
jgi:ketosteroid isomerase-like protein